MGNYISSVIIKIKLLIEIDEIHLRIIYVVVDGRKYLGDIEFRVQTTTLGIIFSLPLY